MKSSVIVFPGSNCDRDIAVALEKMQFQNQMVWHKETKLPKSDLGKLVSLCQTILFLNCIFSNATAISLSQLEPGKTITDDFIKFYLFCNLQ